MKKYLITGAAGFIGSHVAARLVSEGNSVTTIDNLSTGFLEMIPEGVELVEGDCSDEAVINSLSEKEFDCVMHIAGQSSGEISFDNPVSDLNTNTTSTLLLLKYCLKTGCKTFIYASTMSVYGQQEMQPVSEDAKVSPLSFYAVGKIASENYLRIYSKFGVQCTALRLFNVYGQGQNMENLRQGMVSIFIAQAINHGSIVVKGSADRYRDLVHIDDVVEAFMLSESRKGECFECLNVGTGTRTTVGELVTRIAACFPGEVESVYRGNTPGDTFGIVADARRAGKVIGWKSRVKVEEGIREMVDWASKILKR